MKRWIALLIAALALLVVPVGASAAQHHAPKKCPKGKHRNGKKCVKNQVVRGPQGPAGSIGATGAQGEAGPVGPPADVTPAGPSVAYDNIAPESLIDNPVSLGYAATGTTEFGSQIAFGREGGVTDPEVEVLMSVWTCESGEWNAGCLTLDPEATFPAELTLNVYEVTYENQVGALLASATETFDLRYRPTSDPTCSDPTSFKASDGHCQHGLPQSVVFDGLTGTLPHRVIVSVAFSPSGPTNSLNVGVEGPASVGVNPLEQREGIYWDSPGPFSLEEFSGEWQPGESQIAAKVTATQ